MARIKDFIDTTDFTKKELVEMIDLGIAIKKCIKLGYYPQLMKNKVLGMIFEQSSTLSLIHI